MGIVNKQVGTYYDIMHNILQRRGYHQIPNDFLMSIFIGNLYPYEIENIR